MLEKLIVFTVLSNPYLIYCILIAIIVIYCCSKFSIYLDDSIIAAIGTLFLVLSPLLGICFGEVYLVYKDVFLM